jgi:Protein kinase domain
MSPEIFKNKPYNHKSDIWALGCVLYEMTTLNHAFDATSLNGLASKIVKGRYPPVNAKYSTPLKDLIGKMLSIAPADRPDLEKILTLSFIKKHIQNFLGDIMTREHSKLGEGTMVFKAAAVAIANSGGTGAGDDSSFSNLSGNRDMLALQQQMEDLGLQSVVAKALSPPETERPTSAATAVKVAKEQASALRREEDRKQAVESALARLREEREDRQRKRQASIEAVRAAAANNSNNRGTPASAGNGLPPAVQSNNSNRTPGGMLSQAAVAPKPPRPSQVSHAQLAAPAPAPVVASRKSGAAAAAAAVPRESGLRQKLGRGNANDDVSSDPTAAQLPPPGPARGSSGGKRIDVAPVVAVSSSSSSSQARAEAADRLADEALQKRRDDAGRREAARSSKEKSRQQEEQDKLRQDKLDLDRKMAEHEKLREARKERERERISRASASDDTAAVAAAAVRNSSSSSNSNYRDPFDKEAARERERQHRRSDSDSINGSAHGSNASGDDSTSGMSAREKVLARKRAKAAEEEAAQLEALRVAQADSAKHREQRQSRQRGQYVSSMDNNVIATAARSDTAHSNNSGGKHSSSKSGMDSSEVAAKLGAAVGARRYSNSSDTSTATAAAAAGAVDGTTGGTHATSPRSVCSAAETDAGDSSGDSDTDELNGTGGWGRTGGSIDIPNLDGPDEGDEDIHKREEELIAELHMSTMRCEELRTTLQETKSIIGVPGTASSSGVNGSARSNSKAPESARPPAAAHHSTVKVVLEECEDEIDEDTFEGDEIDDDSSSNTSTSANVAAAAVVPVVNAFAKDAERTADSSRYVISSANNVRSDTPGGGRAPRYTEHNSYNNHSLVNEAKGGDDYPYNNSSNSSKSKHSSSHSTAAAVPAVAASKHHSSSSVSSSSGAKGTPRDSGVSSAAFSKSPARSPPSQRGPSPTGRLGDRIRVLRQRCIEGLGQAVFERAYNYLRDLEEQETDADESFGEHSFSDGSCMAGLTDIIGAGKMHYYNLIDQLIFIENTHESTSPS